jgi:phosphoribosyl-ATP pyrophosphohydrolase
VCHQRGQRATLVSTPVFSALWSDAMLYDLFAIIKDRQAQPMEGSYTAQLFAAGQDAILKKVGEEAMEVILAAKGQGNQRVVEEVADLFYHTLVLLADCGLGLDDVEAELRNRHAGRNSAAPTERQIWEEL